MTTPPTFSVGQVLTSSAMNSVGLWLVKSQIITGTPSSVVINSAFSADYDNYRIILTGGTGSASADVSILMTGSPTAYYGSLQYQDYTSGSVSAAGANNSASFPWIGGCTAGQAVHASCDLFGPFLSIYTKIRNGTYQSGNAFGMVNGEHRVASSFTGFTLTLSSGTFTNGTVRVYGYRN